jgi:hypothetical protein
MAKIVYNTCYGGFGLSVDALTRYNELTHKALKSDYDIARDDPQLVQVVEELGKAASGMCADLAIHEVPFGTRWRIVEYDGSECVETPEDIAWNVAKD